MKKQTKAEKKRIAEYRKKMRQNWNAQKRLPQGGTDQYHSKRYNQGFA